MRRLNYFGKIYKDGNGKIFFERFEVEFDKLDDDCVDGFDMLMTLVIEELREAQKEYREHVAKSGEKINAS